jgi:cation diffusion facilitator CzcD-associated flavoprotein CzcO
MTDTDLQTESATVVIVGASAAGLATAACLKKSGVDYILLEQNDDVGGSWRGHYDRLHLHTPRILSGLPHYPMPRHYPRYPSRDQVVAYLEEYADALDLQPRYEQHVFSVQQDASGWITETQDTLYRSRFVVIATGYARQPNMPNFPGQSEFRGPVIHSKQYKTGAAYRGQSVLVVGFGNSGGEIAIDLAEQGARPALSVRHAVNVVPRDVLGIPVLAFSVYSPGRSPRMSDMLFAPVIRATVGDIRKLGLKKLPYGPQQQIARDKRIPLIDIGTLKLIREGRIAVYSGISRFTETGVVFEDGRELALDAVVMATGYRPALHDFLPDAARVTDASGVPSVSGGESALPGLYFCGFFVSPTGMLRAIAREAQSIAAALRAKF